MIERPVQLNDNFYFVPYILKAKGNDLIKSLREIGNHTLRLMEELTNEQEDFAYAENKWTVKQVIRHITDAERVFAYRALRFSRKDTAPLPGFSEDAYAKNDFSANLSIKQIKDDFIQVRKATISLFKTMNPDVLDFEGVASELPMTARMVGWTIAGHNVHHLNVIRERYLGTV